MDSYRRKGEQGVAGEGEPTDSAVRGRALLTIISTIALTEMVEYLAPTGYIFSYLYAVPILTAANQLPASGVGVVTALGVLSTLLGLVVPNLEVDSQTVVNRLIVCSALCTVGMLAHRYHQASAAAEERRLALQSQQELLRTYENFTTALTHDLKTPLQAMAQTLAVFARGRFGPLSTQQQQVVSLFEHSLSRLLELTDTLLAIYRNGGEVSLGVCQPIDLDGLVAGVVARWRDVAAARQVDLGYSGLAGARVEADPLQLERAVTNLVANAVRYTRLHSQVTVSLHGGTRGFELRVSDCGPGIPEEDLERIFERFYQSPLTRQSAGTGLGLYLTRQIVTAHGGRIHAYNNPEQGCTFVIALPGRG